MTTISETCPKCTAALSEPIETPTGKKLQRCSRGSWNPQTRQTEGCDYVKWLTVPPQPLDETCPKCAMPLVLQVTRFGKKMKKCSGGGWDKEAKKPTGCDYVEWLTGKTEPLDELCPECGANLVLFTTPKGKKLEKCSTSGWDREAKRATGCTYVRWLKATEVKEDTGEQFLPPDES